MADHFIGVDIGGGFDPAGLSTGTSTTSKKIELRINDAVSGNSKMEVLKALDEIKAYIVKNNAPA